jgi:phosphatidylcholine synthase
VAARNEQAVPASASAPAARAFAVHVFTACGAGLALLALIAANDRAWPLMFFWLGLAAIVDGIDGTLARRLRAAELLPRWSGDVLDFVVDFATYILVPAYAIATSGLLPPLLALPLTILIAMTGALYCADRRMKTEDNYFRGFPALWNVVAFYVFVLRPDPWLAAAGIVVFLVLTFVPVPFVHPLRVQRARAFNVGLLALWCALALLALAQELAPAPWIVIGLAMIGLYFFGAGLLRRTS